MKSFDSATLARLDAGEVDYLDAATFFFDSGPVSFLIGTVGQIDWTDAEIGAQTFYGLGPLLSIDAPQGALGPEARAITMRLAETYLPSGSDEPVNTFDDGVRTTIDEEPWQGRLCILSCFWLDSGGTPIERETIDIRALDEMGIEIDKDGNPFRVATLERPEITRRDIKGNMRNAEFQKRIDAADTSFAHVGATASQKINFGRREPEPVSKQNRGIFG